MRHGRQQLATTLWLWRSCILTIDFRTHQDYLNLNLFKSLFLWEMCSRVRKQTKKDVGFHYVDCSWLFMMNHPVYSSCRLFCLFNHVSPFHRIWNHEVAALGSEEVAKIEEGFNRLSVRGESPGGVSWKSLWVLRIEDSRPWHQAFHQISPLG